MSFETWLTTTDIPERYIGISHVRDAFEAGRAESEAEIAALQSERDALREALLPFKPSDEDVDAYMKWALPDKPSKYPITATDRDLLRVHSLVSTPASGEPARKP